MAFMPPLTGVRTDTVSVPNPQAGPAPKPLQKPAGDSIELAKQQPSDGLAALASVMAWPASAAAEVAGAAGAAGAAAAAGIASGLAAGAIPVSAGNAGEDAPNAAWRHPLQSVAHPPESHTSVTPAHTEPRSTVGSSTPAKSGVELPNHTGHASGAPQTSPVHISPAHATSGIGTTTTPILHANAADQATLVVRAHDVAQALPGWKVQPQSITRTDPSAARSAFAGGARQQFVKGLATEHSDKLRAAGISNADIETMRSTGDTPEDFEVHHIIALGQGGTNAASNLILMPRSEHRLITAQQNSAMSGMQVGDTKVLDILKPPKGEQVYRAPQASEGGN